MLDRAERLTCGHTDPRSCVVCRSECPARSRPLNPAKLAGDLCPDHGRGGGMVGGERSPAVRHGPGSSKQRTRYAPSVALLALIFPSHHKPSSPLYPKVGSFGKHRGATAAKPFYVRNAVVARRQETLAVAPRKFSLCSTNSHPAVQTVGLAVLIRSAGPVAPYLVA